MLDVRFVTTTDPHVPDLESPALVAALATRGVRAAVAAWDDPAVDWSASRLAVIRSTWDYHVRYAAFLAWAARAAAVTDLWNPLPVVRWNSHKGYLATLAATGVPVVPTELVTPGTVESLAALLARRGWSEAIVKPAVSLGSHLTTRVRAGDPAAQESLDRVLAAGEALVQCYAPAIEREGELSIIFIDGAPSHAAWKRPADGDFRVQVQYGGTLHPAPLDAAAVAIGERALAAVGAAILYARVDLIRIDGALHLMELELIEPNLFLGAAPGALERLCAAIIARLG